MTVNRLLREADSAELEAWRLFLKARSDLLDDERKTAEIQRRLDG